MPDPQNHTGEKFPVGIEQEMTRPPKKRNKGICSSVGNPSTIHGICIFSTPSAKNACICAHFSGLLPCRLSETDISTRSLMQRCSPQGTAEAHNQTREFTQTAYLRRENVGGLTTGEGWRHKLRSGRREFHRYFRDRTPRYPDCLVSGSGQSQQGA